MNNEKRTDDIAGGQALIEGVMMRHENKIASAVRRPDNEIIFQEQYHIPLAKRYKLLGFKFIRGSVSLIEMMVSGMKSLMFSAEMALAEDDKKPGRWEMPISLFISFTVSITLIFYTSSAMRNEFYFGCHDCLYSRIFAAWSP